MVTTSAKDSKGEEEKRKSFRNGGYDNGNVVVDERVDAVDIEGVVLFRFDPKSGPETRARDAADDLRESVQNPIGEPMRILAANGFPRVNCN